MKNNKILSSEFLDEKLEEIKKNKIFDVPQHYFENLEHNIFVQRRSEFSAIKEPPTETRKSRIVPLPTYAASFLVLLGAAWSSCPSPARRCPERPITEYLLAQ